MAEELKMHLPTVVPEYGRGRERICAIVSELLGVTADHADEIVTRLTENGILHYNVSGRTIGVPGHWEILLPDPGKR